MLAEELELLELLATGAETGVLAVAETTAELATTAAGLLPVTLGDALASTLGDALASASLAAPPLPSEPPQPARTVATLSSAITATELPRKALIFMCTRLANWLEPLSAPAIASGTEDKRIDGGVTKLTRRGVTGNPAISCPYRTKDRRLCVPASRRVCP